MSYVYLSDLSQDQPVSQPQPRPTSLPDAATPKSWGKLAFAGAILGGLAFVISRLGPGRSLVSNPGRMKPGVVYEPGETGWVEDMGNGTWRIGNVPFSAPINIDDVVTLKEKGGRTVVDKIVLRVFPKKSGIRYSKPHAKNYKALSKAFEDLGWKFEGAVEGLATLAHDDRKNPKAVAAEVGVEITIEPLKLR